MPGKNKQTKNTSKVFDIWVVRSSLRNKESIQTFIVICNHIKITHEKSAE